MAKKLEKWGKNFDNSSCDYPSKRYEIQPKHVIGLAIMDNQFGSYERSWKILDRDRATGIYKTASTKEVVSHGGTFKERSTGTGRVGYKDEHKSTTTFRIGDRNGYTEYQYQERYRRVDYSSGSKVISSGSGSKVISSGSGSKGISSSSGIKGNSHGSKGIGSGSKGISIGSGSKGNSNGSGLKGNSNGSGIKGSGSGSGSKGKGSGYSSKKYNN